MDVFIIVVVAFFASVLTFFSGFGLGTLLTPVFMVFFPAEVAIALTGVVHLFNNLFKLSLLGGKSDRVVLLRFGVPAVIGALFGALLLLYISKFDSWFQYEFAGRFIEVYPVKSVIGFLLLIFALMDLVPAFNHLEFSKDKMIVGGLLSGFFGGLSGNQGALRSAFLIRAGLSKEAFIATAVVISAVVDISRLGIYATHFFKRGLLNEWPIVTLATFAAISGALVGNRLLKKVTISFIQKTVAILLIVLSICLIFGWL
jgi:uncharacterized membrane protein YfcA